MINSILEIVIPVQFITFSTISICQVKKNNSFLFLKYLKNSSLLDIYYYRGDQDGDHEDFYSS